MAEREGFEPPETCASTVFKTAAFDHSAISPNLENTSASRGRVPEPTTKGGKKYVKSFGSKTGRPTPSFRGFSRRLWREHAT